MLFFPTKQWILPTEIQYGESPPITFWKEKRKEKWQRQRFENYKKLDHVIDYTTNEDGTKKKFYTTGINCEVENAIDQMIATKKKYKKSILVFHVYKSFAKSEVTPEVAHEIGIKLA